MKRYISAIILASGLIISMGQAASGMGLALNMKDDPPGLPPIPEISFASPFARLAHSLTGLEIVMDTAVAKNRLFNYRLNIECGNYLMQKDSIFSTQTYQVNRLLWANTFGFGIVRTRFLRIWAGPQIALAYEFKNRDNYIFDGVIYNTIGPVVGANLHTGENVTLSFEIGFRTGLGIDMKKSLTGIMPEPIAAIRLIFRGSDVYVPGVM